MNSNFSKKKWILDYTKKNYMVDIMNTDFVDQYIIRFEPKHEIKVIGANRCPEIGKFLNSLYKDGLMERSTVGIGGRAWYVGMPKWVYCYTLTQLGKDVVEFDDLAKELLG